MNSTIILPLGDCLTMPSSVLYQQMDRKSLDCNRLKNAMIERAALLLRQNGYVPGKGKKIFPDDINRMFASTMYKEIAPGLSSRIAAACWNVVNSHLASRLPYDRERKSKIRWQGIVDYEVSLTTFRSPVIPIRAGDMTLCWNGMQVGKHKETIRGGESQCVIKFPLFSVRSGFDKCTHVLRIRSGSLSADRKRLLRSICEGDLKLCGSQFVRNAVKRKNKWLDEWRLHLAYERKTKSNDCNRDRICVFSPASPRRVSRTFQANTPDMHKCLGAAIGLAKEHERLELRRAGIRTQSRYGGSGGHGKGNFYGKLRKYSRGIDHMKLRFIDALVNELMQTCDESNCGSITYREPTLPLRELLWFGKHHIPFPWSRFELRMKAKLMANGFHYCVDRIGTEEHKIRYEWE